MKCEECGNNAVQDAGYDDECVVWVCENCDANWEECPDDEDFDRYSMLPDDDLNDLGYPLD